MDTKVIEYSMVTFMQPVDTSLGPAVVVAELAGANGLLLVALKGSGIGRVYCPTCKLAFSPKYDKCPNYPHNSVGEPSLE